MPKCQLMTNGMKPRSERILLHSLATSSVSPGVESTTRPAPPAVANRRWAEDAEACCKKLTMLHAIQLGRATMARSSGSG